MDTIPLRDTQKRIRDITVAENPPENDVEVWMRDWDGQTGGRGDSEHWDWNEKRKVTAYDTDWAFVALTEGARCHGMMIVIWPRASWKLPPVELLYVDYLEVAPMHRHGPPQKRDLTGVGAALVNIAIRISHAKGLYGRIGLHSISSAEPFYRKRGMTEWYSDPDYENMIYFEQV